MANLFTNKICKSVELSIGDVCLLPITMKHLPAIEKVASQDIGVIERAALFVPILKEVLVDENGKPFDDLQKMTAEEFNDGFPVEDFQTLLMAMMPMPEDKEQGNLPL